MLGWLLVIGLGIIWAIFLFPFLRRRRSPVTTVEEFEQKMDFLAETNVASRGRWVIAPRKGERFLGERGRNRSRVRERRRQVFTLLLEATGLALLIGLFPPFHRILLGAAILGGLFLVYALLLVRVRSVEDHRAKLRRARPSAVRPTYAFDEAPSWLHGNGRATLHRADAEADGWSRPAETVLVLEPDDEPVLYVDEDVHIVVHRSDELNLHGLRAALAR
jgi:hypothetical protein